MTLIAQELEFSRNIMTTSCAGCGIKENDNEDIKLKMCNACKSVRYCSVQCQKEHWPKHKKACKKRTAELRDELLFKQPESSNLGDCPICFLPLPIDINGTGVQEYNCCSKYICTGCSYTSFFKVGGVGPKKCPFCRKATNLSDDQIRTNYERRAEANDPSAIHTLGRVCHKEGDLRGAFTLISRSAKLGYAEGAFDLALMYRDGIGVEKNEKKMVFSFEDAAIAGHPEARAVLANVEWGKGRHERAVKHLIIGSKLGHAGSVEDLKIIFEEGKASKEELDAAVSGYEAAVEATKSKDREEAEAMRKKFSNLSVK